jgi:hypothetical protein
MSKFRRLCKHEEKMYKQNIYNDMSNNIDKNPKTFWNMLNKLKKLHTNHDSVHDIPQDNFFQFFQTIKTVNFMSSLLKFQLLKEKLGKETFDNILDNITF